MTGFRVFIIVILILIVVGLWLAPTLTKSLLTGAASMVKDGATGLV